MQAMYDWCVRLTSPTLICGWVNEREEDRINVHCSKFAVNWLPTSFCINWFCIKVQQRQVHVWQLPGQAHLLQICSGLISVIEFKREKLKPKQLLLQLKIVLPWSGARRKEEIQFSLFVDLWLLFFGWHFYT